MLLRSYTVSETPLYPCGPVFIVFPYSIDCIPRPSIETTKMSFFSAGSPTISRKHSGGGTFSGDGGTETHNITFGRDRPVSQEHTRV